MRDHHIMHAARGVAHVWTAAIVAGLAVVLTGAIAYTAVEAQSTTDQPTQDELKIIRIKLDNLEKNVSKLNQQYSDVAESCNKDVRIQCEDRCQNTKISNETSEVDACLKNCIDGSGDVKTTILLPVGATSTD